MFANQNCAESMETHIASCGDYFIVTSSDEWFPNIGATQFMTSDLQNLHISNEYKGYNKQGVGNEIFWF